MIEKEPISLQKCPNCGFHPVEGCTTCPKCGFSLQLNDQLNTDNDMSTNDTIEWSELADMPIESVQKMFKDNEDKMKEEEKAKEIQDTPEMNPILAQYIRDHKDSDEDLENEESDIETEIHTANKNETQESAEEIETEEDLNISEKDVETKNSNSVNDSNEGKSESDEVIISTKKIEETDIVEPQHFESENEKDDGAEVLEKSDEGNGKRLPENSDSSGKPPRKNYKKIYITLAAIAVLGAGGGYYFHHEKEVEAQRVATIKKENKELDAIEESIASYYVDDTQTFIATDKLSLNTSKIDEELAGYKENKRYESIKKEYDELVDKQKIEQSVNQLFVSPAINGSEITDKPLLKSAEPVNLTVNTNDQKFNELMNQAINNAKEQYSKFEAAKKATDDLFKDGNVIDSINRDQYNSANNAVKNVANQALVQTQKNQLAKVDQMLKDKEKKAADEKAAAEKAAQEKAEREKAEQQKQVSSDTVGDTSSDAYAWAPGVREKVIQTCISRGYIVEGGYSLEPVKVENGEGYYNLYATSNRASLTKGYTDSDLPMYLVTINCKTGWFKGNGPN